MWFPGQSIRSFTDPRACVLVATTVLAGKRLPPSACASGAGDYYANCSTYGPDGPQVRSCMRTAGFRKVAPAW